MQALLSDASRLECFFNVLTVHVSLCKREKNFLPDTCASGLAQRTDVPALVLRFCVQLLLKRGATTLSSRDSENVCISVVSDAVSVRGEECL